MRPSFKRVRRLVVDLRARDRGAHRRIDRGRHGRRRDRRLAGQLGRRGRGSPGRDPATEHAFVLGGNDARFDAGARGGHGRARGGSARGGRRRGGARGARAGRSRGARAGATISPAQAPLPARVAATRLSYPLCFTSSSGSRLARYPSLTDRFPRHLPPRSAADGDLVSLRVRAPVRRDRHGRFGQHRPRL